MATREQACIPVADRFVATVQQIIVFQLFVALAM
jgi:hypothetical protein